MTLLGLLVLLFGKKEVDCQCQLEFVLICDYSVDSYPQREFASSCLQGLLCCHTGGRCVMVSFVFIIKI